MSGLVDIHKFANVFYLSLTGSSIASSDLNTFASDVAGFWNTRFAPQLNQVVALNKVDIVYVPSVGNELTGLWTGSHTGQVSSAEVENSGTSYLINWAINAYYRGGHPRWYLPGVSSVAVSNGSAVSGTYISNLTTAATNFMNDVNGQTTTNISAAVIGTMSFATGNSWRGTPLFRAFKAASCSGVIGMQRRRIKS
jgi:hypothetical protein